MRLRIRKHVSDCDTAVNNKTIEDKAANIRRKSGRELSDD